MQIPKDAAKQARVLKLMDHPYLATFMDTANM